MWIDEQQEEEEPRGWLTTAARVGFGLLVFGAVGALIYSLAHQQTNAPVHSVTTITRVLLPPPPPPPKPPEPKKVEEQPKLAAKPIEKPLDKPQQKPVQAPPRSPLTAEAGTGSNPYGLQVGNGSGNVIGGTGGGGSEGWQLYAGTIRSQVQGALRRDDKTRYGRWQVAVKIWLSATGTVTRAEIVNASGDAAVDNAIMRDLDGLGVGQAPPQGMPQPVRLHIAAEPG
jgi:protein TonB